VGEELKKALVTPGFAYLLKSGLSSTTVKEVFSTSLSFFESPKLKSTEEKTLVFPRDPVTTQGYIGPNVEKLDALKEDNDREQVSNIKALKKNDWISYFSINMSNDCF